MGPAFEKDDNDMYMFSEPFKITNGVKQGCDLAPTLFGIVCIFKSTDGSLDSQLA